MTSLDRTVAGTVFAVVLFGGVCSAEEFQVNTFTQGNQRSTSFAVASSPAGQFVAVWESGHDGSPNGVFAQRFDAGGTSLGGELQVNTYTPGLQGGAAVAMGAGGDFFVVWESNHQDGNAFGVFARRYDSGGTPLGGEFQVPNTTANNQIDPTVAALPSGGYVAVWEAWGQPSIGAISIYGRCYSSAGAPLGPEFPVNTTVSFDLEPSVGADPTGGFVVVWARLNAGTYGRRFNANCTPKNTEFAVDPGVTQPSSVAVGSGGNFFVAWGFDSDGSGSAVAARRYASNGNPVGAAFQVNTYTPGDQNYPVVAADPGGGFVVAWESAGQDGDAFGVFARRYAQSGTPMTGEIPVNGFTTGSQSRPAITTGEATEAMVVWKSGGQDGDGDGVFARFLRCGDGVVDPEEDCDDGNVLDGDCCSAQCQAAPNGSPCSDSVTCTAGDTCQDGRCVPGECQVGEQCVNPCDPGVYCHGSASACGCSKCGNGVVETGEQCDDGNASPGDGCTALCRLESQICTLDEAAFCQGGSNDGQPCSDTATHGDCPPGAPDARCIANSTWTFNDFDSAPLFTWPFGGQVTVECGQIDPVTGKDACACNVLNLEPVNLSPLIGWACFGPALCSAGEIDCNGGEPLDTELIQDHRIGNCGLTFPAIGNSECADQCASYCDGLPGSFTVYDSSCEGYCQGGANADETCTFDVDCPGGTCAGGEPVAHGNKCNCQCLQVGGGASRASGFTCDLGVRITIENNLPCDGLDVRTVWGDVCIPLTTETAKGTLLDSNIGGPPITGELVGTPLSCPAMATDVSGLVLGGNLSFFDTSLGDLEVPIRISCD